MTLDAYRKSGWRVDLFDFIDEYRTISYQSAEETFVKARNTGLRHVFNSASQIAD